MKNILYFFTIKFFFPKYFNLLKFLIFSNFRLNNPPYLPITMDVEPTTGCNFRCTMCQVSSPNFKSQNMSIETFKSFIVQNKQLLKIKLQGMGEPTVNNKFLDMIDIANRAGIIVEFTTNGSLLNKEFVAELLKKKISKITISIDGATKETFEKIRVKSNFNSIIENISSLIQQSKEIYLRPKICAWTVVQKDNIHEFEEIFYLSNQIGFDELSYQFHISDWGKQEWHDINKNKLIDINQKKNFINNMIYKKEFKTKVNIFTENILTFKKKCKWPVRSSYIDNQGYVSPCCIIGDSKVINFGNINKTSYSKIWKSTEYIQFRKSINENKIPSFCKNCYR
jgi:radical SAM protein with 4Fe4S-binding SPASM domain